MLFLTIIAIQPNQFAANIFRASSHDQTQTVFFISLWLSVFEADTTLSSGHQILQSNGRKEKL